MSALQTSSDDRIQVVVRLRPRPRDDQGSPWSYDTQQMSQGVGGQSYAVDTVFAERASNMEVYMGWARPIAMSVLAGINSTIVAYGQTSTGKTHTMMGTADEPGLTPLAIRDVFGRMLESLGVEFLARISYLEIYNESINDLLDPERSNLRLQQEAATGACRIECKEVVVTSAEQTMEIMKKADANRHVGATNMNERSSRSHAIFRMVLESRCCDDADEDGGAGATGNDEGKRDVVKVSMLTLVDLAGSERIGHTGAEGVRKVEAGQINRSLLTLGTVISKLSEGATGHVPYRDSKLTRMLQPALGGNARTGIVCTVSLLAPHCEETVSTLKFATRAKSIQNRPVVNEVLDDAALLRKYRKEIAVLRRKLQQLEDIRQVAEQTPRPPRHRRATTATGCHLGTDEENSPGCLSLDDVTQTKLLEKEHKVASKIESLSRAIIATPAPAKQKQRTKQSMPAALDQGLQSAQGKETAGSGDKADVADEHTGNTEILLQCIEDQERMESEIKRLQGELVETRGQLQSTQEKATSQELELHAVHDQKAGMTGTPERIVELEGHVKKATCDLEVMTAERDQALADLARAREVRHSADGSRKENDPRNSLTCNTKYLAEADLTSLLPPPPTPFRVKDLLEENMGLRAQLLKDHEKMTFMEAATAKLFEGGPDGRAAIGRDDAVAALTASLRKTQEARDLLAQRVESCQNAEDELIKLRKEKVLLIHSDEASKKAAADARREIREQQAKLKDADRAGSKIAELREKVRQLSEEKTKLLSEKVLAEKECKSLMKQKESLEKAVKTSGSSSSSAGVQKQQAAKTAALESELAASQKAVAELNGKLQEERAAREAVGDKERRLREQLTEMSLVVEEQQARLQMYQGYTENVARLEAELRSAKEKSEAVVTELPPDLESLQSQFREREAELEAHRNEVLEENMSLRSKAGKLQRDCDEYRRQQENQLVQFQTLKSECDKKLKSYRQAIQLLQQQLEEARDTHRTP